jgi:hypothetical protein
MHELILTVGWTFSVREKAALWEPCQQTHITASVKAARIDVALFPLILELLVNFVT